MLLSLPRSCRDSSAHIWWSDDVGPHCQSTEACTHTRLRQAPRRGAPVSALMPTAETGSALFLLHMLLPPPQLCSRGQTVNNSGEMHFCTTFIYWLLQRGRSPWGNSLKGLLCCWTHWTPPFCSPSPLAPSLLPGGSPLARCWQAEFWGLLRFGVSVLLSSALTKPQLGFLSRLGGCQGKKTKQCRMHPALLAARASRSTASALPSKHCPTSRATGWQIWDGDGCSAAGGTADEAK